MFKKIKMCSSGSLRRLFSTTPAVFDDNKPKILQEAMNACNLAKNLTTDKAMKLLNHAVQLSPNEPYILEQFGKFLFENGDFLAANELFSKADMISPGNSEIENYRDTTNSIVNKVLSERIDMIRGKKETLRTVEKSQAVLQAIEEMFFSFCYHSISLEGIGVDSENTQNMKRACLFAEEYLKSNEFSKHFLLEIHRNIFGSADEEAGRFRNIPVFINGRKTTDVDELHPELDEFINWCNSTKNSSVSEIEFASNVHLKFVTIHPFLDGNGRVARILLTAILRQHQYPFIVIPKTEINEYYDALVKGQLNNGVSFAFYVAKCMEQVLDRILSQV